MNSLQPVVIGGTYDWLLDRATINTLVAPHVYGPWNISAATITVSFINPSGVASHFSATALATTGSAHYVNATALFTVAGQWTRSWKISLSGIVLESQLETFTVYASGAAL